MQKFLPILCQDHCPYGKHCCFGEVNVESIGDMPLVEKHKCKCSKNKDKKFVIVKIERPK